jgi:hypothetical protein
LFRGRPMLRELAFFGALAPSLLLYFLAAIPLFVIVAWLVAHLRVYQFVGHPPLARFGLFLFSVLVLSARS